MAFGTTQVRCQLDNQTTATRKWDIATVLFPIGNRTVLLVQGNDYWLKAQVQDGKADSKLLFAMKGVQVRALQEASSIT